jgi:hypothetical protein
MRIEYSKQGYKNPIVNRWLVVIEFSVDGRRNIVASEFHFHGNYTSTRFLELEWQMIKVRNQGKGKHDKKNPPKIFFD